MQREVAGIAVARLHDQFPVSDAKRVRRRVPQVAVTVFGVVGAMLEDLLIVSNVKCTPPPMTILEVVKTIKA